MIVQFDSENCTLWSSIKPDVFAATHSIPVAYQRDPSYVADGYLSYRLIARNEIEAYLRRNADDVQVFSVYLNDKIQSNAKELRIPEHPPHKIISVRGYDDPGGRLEGLEHRAFRLLPASFEGQVRGVFKSGYVGRLPIVPFFTIGCKFSSETSKRTCQAEFATERVPMESRPNYLRIERSTLILLVLCLESKSSPMIKLHIFTTPTSAMLPQCAPRPAKTRPSGCCRT